MSCPPHWPLLLPFPFLPPCLWPLNELFPFPEMFSPSFAMPAQFPSFNSQGFPKIVSPQVSLCLIIALLLIFSQHISWFVIIYWLTCMSTIHLPPLDFKSHENRVLVYLVPPSILKVWMRAWHVVGAESITVELMNVWMGGAVGNESMWTVALKVVWGPAPGEAGRASCPQQVWATGNKTLGSSLPRKNSSVITRPGL